MPKRKKTRSLLSRGSEVTGLIQTHENKLIGWKASRVSYFLRFVQGLEEEVGRGETAAELAEDGVEIEDEVENGRSTEEEKEGSAVSRTWMAIQDLAQSVPPYFFVVRIV